MGGHGKGIAAGVGLLLSIFGIVLTLLLTQTGQSIKTYVTNHGAKPTCSHPRWLLQIPDSQISTIAFYVPRPYFANQTVDGNPNTAWLQWWPTADFYDYRPGDNYIQWNLPDVYNLRLICIVDGWTQDTLTYNGTGPIHKAKINLLNKHCSRYTKMFNNKGFTTIWQPVRVSCKTSKVRLYVKSVYHSAITKRYCKPPPPGSGVNGCRRLTGLSEIRFYYSPGPLSGVPWNAPAEQG